MKLYGKWKKEGIEVRKRERETERIGERFGGREKGRKKRKEGTRKK